MKKIRVKKDTCLANWDLIYKGDAQIRAPQQLQTHQ